MSEDFLKYEKEFEGCKLKAYRCPAGVLTIGYGHTMDVKENDVISLDRANKLLIADFELLEKRLSRKYRWFNNLHECEKYAILDLTYNIGFTRFCKTSFNKLMLKFYDNKNYHNVIAAHFMKFIYANGKVLNGLVRRRRFCYNLFMYHKYCDVIL